MRTKFHAVVAAALLLAACSRTETPGLGDPVTIASGKDLPRLGRLLAGKPPAGGPWTRIHPDAIGN